MISKVLAGMLAVCGMIMYLLWIDGQNAYEREAAATAALTVQKDELEKEQKNLKEVRDVLSQTYEEVRKSRRDRQIAQGKLAKKEREIRALGSLLHDAAAVDAWNRRVRAELEDIQGFRFAYREAADEPAGSPGDGADGTAAPSMTLDGVLKNAAVNLGRCAVYVKGVESERGVAVEAPP